MGVDKTPRRVLITGAAGHIGVRLVEYLASQPDIQLRLATHHTTISAFADYGELVTGDLLDAEFCTQLVSRCDAVVNLASVPTQSAVDSIAIRQHDTMITNLLRAVQSNMVRRFVHLSSIHVHGSMLQGVITEATPIAPTTPYGKAHAHAEELILRASADAAALGDTSTAHLILRCTNGFGASNSLAQAPWSLLTGDLCLQAAAGSILRLSTHGEHQRDFITISDLVQAIAFFLLQSPETGVVLLGSGVSITLREMAYVIAARAGVMFGRQYSVTCNDNDYEIPTRYRLDTRHLRECGFVPVNEVDREIDLLLAAAARRLGP